MTGFEIAVVLAASAVGAFVKAITGMGYPLFAIPIITLVVGIEDAAVVVAAPNVTANFVLCWQARAARHEARDLPVIVGTSIAGAVVGTFLLVSIDEDVLLVALVVAIVAFMGNYLRSPEFRLASTTTARLAPVAGTVAGVFQGAVGVSGPIVASWLHGYRLRPEAYVFSVTAIFGISGLTQLVVLAASGEYTADRTFVSALAFIPALGVLPLGRRLRGRLGSVGFERAVLAILAVSAVALVWRVAT